MINVLLKNGSSVTVESGKPIYDFTGDLGYGVKENALAVTVDGKLIDLRSAVEKDCVLEILTFNDAGGKWTLRHTAAHLLAQAVKRLYPSAKLAIGPAIDDGFYYDFEFDKPLASDELWTIEQEMLKIAKEELEPERFTLPRDKALELMLNESYKAELINELPEGEEISFYRQGEFVDLCAGPHVMNTRVIKAIKLTAVAGAYWRGSEKNKMLTRIYGTAYTTQSDLDAYLAMMEEAKKRDHRKLGRELQLFALMDEGQGLPFLLPNGVTLRNVLVDYWRGVHKKAGYVEVSTPFMLNKELWQASGHWENYIDNMFRTEIDGHVYCIKPMNCPGGILLYKQGLHSYRDFPLRMGELGVVHRYEKSGVLHGMMRVRCFTQDDAHIYITPEQITEEVKAVVKVVDDIYDTFNFTYTVELSTRPEKSVGTAEQWERATKALKTALDEIGKPYKINDGDGAFYGPKIDFHLRDAIGRTWQCGTIQLDFNLPERLNMEYFNREGEKQRPVMIHRTIYGSLERFMGMLIEHYAGHFPLWLAPVQAIVLSISEKFVGYANSVLTNLEEGGFRIEADLQPEKIGYKIRAALNRRIPYILVVGENEENNATVSFRSRTKDEGEKPLGEIMNRMKEEVRTRSNGVF